MQMQDLVGQQFGNYRLTRLIGKGGYAEVYLAEHIHLNNLQHAIKVLTGTNLKDYQREEFLAEARTIANLQRLNSHIVQIQDFGIQSSKDGIDGGIPYFVMEYAPEGTLRNLYPHGTKVPLERIIFYIKQTAEALQCAHDQTPPIVHRDVKPENMLLRSLDHVLLSDFGIAVTGKTGLQVKPVGETGVIGTATYMAPERLSNHTRRASDQYSLGIVVYEWLCGYPPFDGTDKEICYKQLAEPPPPLYPMHPHVTKEIEDALKHALAKKPEDRYPTVQAFTHALEVAVQSALRQNGQIWQPIGNVGGQQGVKPPGQGGPPKDQLNLRQSVYPHHNSVGTTEPLKRQPPQQVLPPVKPVAKPARQPFKKIRDFFDFSPQFARDRRYSFFRSFGIFLNILSAIIIGLLLQNIYVLLGGLIFSLLMFALCVRAVEEILAMFFGTMVALYWGGVGWVIGSFIASLLDFDRLFPSMSVGLVFFGVSLGLHIWYVSRKNS